MLISFSVCNFKSIGEDLNFSMLASKDVDINEFLLNKLQIDEDEVKVLKRAAFFGPNASGKTSFIDAFEFARNIICNQNANANVLFYRKAFKAFKLEKPTEYRFVIAIKNTIYSYYFSLNSFNIIEEKLEKSKKGELITLFDIKYDDTHNAVIKFDDDKETDFAKLLILNLDKEHTNNQQLFLTRLFSFYKDGESKDLFNFFCKNIIIIKAEDTIIPFPPVAQTLLLNEDAYFKDYLKKFFNIFNTGIKEIQFSKVEVNLEDFVARYNLPQDFINEVLQNRVSLVKIIDDFFIVTFNYENNKTIIHKLVFTHILNGVEHNLDLSEESDGIKKLLQYMPLFASIKEKSILFLIDELDRNLHPLLSKFLLKSFLDISKKSHQLIFTTHETQLLSRDVLHTDEIWLVNKNNKGQTDIIPMSDFDDSEIRDREKDYLLGRYGSIPNFSSSFDTF